MKTRSSKFRISSILEEEILKVIVMGTTLGFDFKDKELGQNVGEALWVEEETIDRRRLDRGRFLALILPDKKISSGIKVSVGGIPVILKLMEDHFPMDFSWVDRVVGLKITSSIQNLNFLHTKEIFEKLSKEGDVLELATSLAYEARSCGDELKKSKTKGVGNDGEFFDKGEATLIGCVDRLDNDKSDGLCNRDNIGKASGGNGVYSKVGSGEKAIRGIFLFWLKRTWWGQVVCMKITLKIVMVEVLKPSFLYGGQLKVGVMGL
ncbi:hypothetical protein LWI28_026051 [Acer negundo]|uniref:Uncharacterized protein n=1 Tax=Acer negundo TaxID=4023 RepID=A0AAD5IHD1_ACENE|nr:hypothetical protein LWI28_026051 [Acer negundo]